MMKMATLSEIEQHYSLDDLMDLHDVMDYRHAVEEAQSRKKGGG